ncbi:MAG: N-acetyl sugar amidotransferase [Desulfobacteraceae bacterium]|jgi:N-acetyl sugar amidotransferase|nr:MAG: N-acetyl sugar amidotransferase [Desulfobacteraceae bacterium]
MLSVESKYQICSKGIWDTSVPGIAFDEEGVSNYCRFQEYMMNAYPRGKKGMKNWLELVDRMKRKGQSRAYDCVVGVSGGVDSSYLLVLMREYGLRSLAVNLDNGFSSDIAVQNIYKVTKALDVDLETYVIDYEEVKDVLYAHMRSGIPWIDGPTDAAIKAVMYKVALNEKIKFIIRGNDFRSEGKQPAEWTQGPNLRYIHKQFGRGIALKTFPHVTPVNLVYAGFFKKIKDIRPYYYLEYSKQEAREILSRDFDWRDYGGHHHENLFTKFAMAYWLPKKFGIDKRRINLSAQVLSGVISRDEALKAVAKPFAPENELEALKDYVLKKLDISDEEFHEIWSAPNRSAAEYPSDRKLIQKLMPIARPVIKRMYSFVPMSVMADDYFKQGKN